VVNVGYSGVILDVGDAATFHDLLTSSGTYFFPSQSNTNVQDWLVSMKECYAKGYEAEVGTAPSVWLGFSNYGSSQGTSGTNAGGWEVYGGFTGAWVDFEGGWSSEAAAVTELTNYEYQGATGKWRDSGFRDGGDWTYSQMIDYINNVLDQVDGGQKRNFLWPENYKETMYTCGDYPIDNSNCSSENPWIGSYVGSVTVENTGSYTDQEEWENYESHPYPDIASSSVAVVQAYQKNNTGWARW